MIPNCGFPLRLVEQYDSRQGVWRSRRGSGQTIAAGRYRFGGKSFAEVQLSVPQDAPKEVYLTAHLCERALHLVLKRFEERDILTQLLGHFSGGEVTASFMRGHDLLADCAADGQSLRLDSDTSERLGIHFDHSKGDLQAIQPEILRGFELLLSLAQFHLLQLIAGTSPRAALHRVLDLYQAFSLTEQTYLHQVLEGKALDSGNLFSLFLGKATTPPADLAEDAVTHWRNRQITWLLGQDRVDLPYDRRKALDILHSDQDPDEKRWGLYNVLRDYDRDLERRNVARIAAEVRQSRQQLVFGRMSRAFHNQATLFADAVLLRPGAALQRLAGELVSTVDEDAPLRPVAEELRLLLESPYEVSLTQIEGACERFEEAVLEAQKQDLLDFLKNARERLEDHADELTQAPLPSLSDTAIVDITTGRLNLIESVRGELLKAPKRHAAYVVISQRPSPTGSHLLAKINEFEEPYLGKSENLLKLVRLAGDRVYSSPDYFWLEVADHWVEAIPLFIKEQVAVVDGQETAHTVIDIAGMEESFREQMADHWARNIRQVVEDEWIDLGRRHLARHLWPGEAIDTDEAIDRLKRRVPAVDIAAVATLVGALYLHHITAVHNLVEAEEISSGEALEVLLDDASSPFKDLADLQPDLWGAAVRNIFEQSSFELDFDEYVERLRSRALERGRPQPTLHVLTTQSAGMTEGYIRTWLEESMALYNIVEERGLQEAVDERLQYYAARILTLGEKVIRELGIWVEVEEIAAREQITSEAAVQRVADSNRDVQRELACLGVLYDFEEGDQGRRSADHDDDPADAVRYLEQHAAELRESALEQVAARNGEALHREVHAYRRQHPDSAAREALRQVVDNDADYRQDLETYTRFAARHRVLEELSAAHPQLQLQERLATYLRRYQRLAKTTARKEILGERGLNHLALHPRYYYQATGANKRYHLLYTPSRVDLGHRERESVETWAQWVGGADRAAARVGRQIYGLINKAVHSYDSLTQPELLKTGENASMASHFAFSNALSLMVSASRHGDIEEMGDQMSRRKDRLIHPAGEGYGGYCVPKDGLFLEFVLTLSRAEKLRQLGVPVEAQQEMMAFAHTLLEQRDDFDSQLAWEQWAAGLLQERDDLAPAAFQATRIAHVLENLGQPEARDPYRVTTGLAAQWSIHKMVAGGEHVNRFMPFFKTWLLRQGLAEAARRHPHLPIDAQRGVIALSAEYKPDTQDGRFSAGMRKFEILAGTGSHLLHALDADGQEVAILMHEGYNALEARGKGARALYLMGVDQDDAEQVDQIRALLPGFAPPVEMRLVSPTGLSTQDLLNYTSDSELEHLADRARAKLMALGFSETEIEANALTYGPRLENWAHLADISPEDKAQIADDLDGQIHALILEIVGPERSYERALQGADVLDTGIPHRELLDLLDDPARICDLMLEGNPHSALVVVDGASGARRRAMNRCDIMLWFAVGLRHERQAVYTGIGLGAETVESWRAEMLRLRRRAERLGEAIKSGEADRARQLYDRIVEDIRDAQEVQLQLGEAEKLHRFGRQRPRDRHIGQALARLDHGLALEDLCFGDFLALGGLFLLDGQPEEEIRAYRLAFEAGIAEIGGPPAPPAESPIENLLHARFRPVAEEFREEKGIESSNKASEEQPAIALEARRQLAERIEQARALNQRQAAFEAVNTEHISFDAAYRAAKNALGNGDADVSETVFGTFMGWARNALLALASQLYDEDRPEQTQGFIERLGPLFNGRQLDPQDWRAVAGGYEDIGDFGRLAQRCAEGAQRHEIDAEECQRQLQQIARAAELFYILLAVDTTIDVQRRDTPDVQALWHSLADFFAETINDHFYEYRPWVFSRGIGFAAYRDDSLYELAVEHHGWLYRYLRYIITCYTEVAALPVEERDLLLGNFLDANQVEALGGGGASPIERQWRSYGQLRELTFIRNDGFPLPEVFAQFDPVLIAADRRVNHVIALPVGRTHYSRAMREGPTLSKHLEAEGRPGANLLITRWASLESIGRDRPVIQVDNAFFYVDATTFRTALLRHKDLSEAEAEQRAAAVHPKGVNIAAAFTRPVQAALVYPFHGHPLYDSGALEDCGLPYTVQSLFHTWTTYDKAKYPDIFPPSSGVDTPLEIDWLAAYTDRASDESTAKKWIEDGLDSSPYPGLHTFAGQHRLVMIKDAAESGGRNAGAFLLRRLDGSIDAVQFADAIDFIYQISLRHNVSIQEVILASPEYWASEEFLQSFVARQIVDWGSAVDRQRRPRTHIYGSHRIILSTDDPTAEDLSDKWHISHWITLNSKQLITNVGRGGNLEQFLPEFIRPEYREAIQRQLTEAGARVMEALAAYETRSAASYETERDRPVGTDLMGVSYGVPRYMMLDFLIAPVFAEEGEVVDIQPRYDDQGRRIGSVFLLQDSERSFPGTIADWRVVLIEPNIGVGLWDRVALREEYHERQNAQEAGREINWEAIGHNARIVLDDLSRAGEQYLQSLRGEDAQSS